jgi:hypothetical protein
MDNAGVHRFALPIIAALFLAANPSLGSLPHGNPPQGQEPDRARPAPAPADAKTLPPVPEPFVSPVPRLDLPMRFTPRDPLEGFWELRARSIGGKLAPAGRGLLSIGRSHLVVQFHAPGTDPELPLLRAGAYSWQHTGERQVLMLTVLASHFNDAGGKVHIEPVGSVEIRRFELLADGLRVYQADGGSFLEFVRAE